MIVDDPQVSRRHCVFVVHADHTCEVYDQASTNGTYLDRQKVTRAMPVPVGVPIRIGKTVLELRR